MTSFQVSNDKKKQQITLTQRKTSFVVPAKTNTSKGLQRNNSNRIPHKTMKKTASHLRIVSHNFEVGDSDEETIFKKAV